MIEGWEEAPLEELIEVFLDYRGKTPPKTDEGVPLITAKIVKGGRIETPTEFISKKTYETWMNRGYPQTNDVVLTVEAPLGEVAILKDSYVVPGQRIIMMRPKAGTLDSGYLKYYFQSEIGQHALSSRASGTTVMGIKAAILRKVPIPYPDLREQKATAEVLSSLDDKIDLLHRQNATLEALAETLFRQYFIEEAQDDWKDEPLDQVANYVNGLACQKYPAKNPVERLPVLKIKDLKNGLSDSSDWATSKVPAEYIVENGDIIFSWSASLLVKLWDGPKCVLNQHLFKVTSERFPDWFIYQWTKHHLDRFIAIAETKATTMGHIKRSDLAAAMVKIPDDGTLAEAEDVFAPIQQKVIGNSKQIATLIEKRDALLPKLMSGEVRVKFEAANA